ncbi:AAA family ATPase [Williamsia sp.]|uniref:AAA family ATPase n=1 Tax=Williamsia sp. TaxID=1872085 RepID=UPI001A216779|nr:AAA family ATPase [Williamsia sp.]MBJ7289184.1 AAA family ATPase [Williamsia sp.]
MQRVCAECLVDDGSLLHPGQQVWTEGNVADLYDKFIKNAFVGSEGGGTFDSKWRRQLDGTSDGVRRLAAEIMLVHFLFPSSVSFGHKKRLIAETLQLDSLDDLEKSESIAALKTAIGNPGIGFNTRRDLQIGFVIEFVRLVKALDPLERAKVLADPWLTRDLAEQVPQENQREMMHILLHLLHPDSFERIASLSHKRQIAKAFANVDESPVGTDADSPVDQELWRIRSSLEGLMPDGNAPDGKVDFYYPPLSSVWSSRAADSVDGVTDLESLAWKKQIILYGPPGTGKTYSARQLATELISNAALTSWGIGRFLQNEKVLKAALKKNFRTLQLHPGYGYADFIRGAQLINNETRFEPGFLIEVLKDHNSQQLHAADGSELPSLPTVLLLDEINRTDLSAMLGEAFSLFERDKRGHAIVLPGVNHGEKAAELTLPKDLYIVGTMNEIDQSVETLDFALRRRFLWKRCPFDRNALIEIVESRWTHEIPSRFAIELALPQIERFADAAAALNSEISRIDDLGDMYEVGHSYFADIVFFIAQWLEGRSKSMVASAIWMKNGLPRAPLQDLWSRSLEPLLAQYLASVDNRQQLLASLWKAFSSS